MKVQEVELECNRKRYTLIDDNGIPIIPATKYLKYLDNANRRSSGEETWRPLFTEALGEKKHDERIQNAHRAFFSFLIYFAKYFIHQ